MSKPLLAILTLTIVAIVILTFTHCSRRPLPTTAPRPSPLQITAIDPSAGQHSFSINADHPLAQAVHDWLITANQSSDWQTSYVSYAPVAKIRTPHASINFVGTKVILNRPLDNGQSEQVSRHMTDTDRALFQQLEAFLHEQNTTKPTP